MNSSFARIIALLAAARISPREVDEFIGFARTMSRNEIAAYMREFERSIGMEERAGPFKPSYFSKIVASSNLERFSGLGLEANVERLLLHEAGLSKLEAVEALTREIIRKYPGKKVPSESRKGFSAWVSKLSKIISESEILYLATKVRNLYVSDAPGDWRL